MKAKMLRGTLSQEQEAQVWSPLHCSYDIAAAQILEKSDVIHTGLKGKSNPLRHEILLLFGKMWFFFLTKFYCDAVETRIWQNNLFTF